ncbi:hypothetical protein [Thiocystis violascens]|uniref:hypothetical protein n=1 Tax=Thiocystis violascens TaxID=73141 RepID=UPI00022C03A2|nr:hypothetical protein [Thiocystis violascens]
MALRWRDVDLKQRTVTVAKTKNGQPLIGALSARAASELAKLAGQEPDLRFPRNFVFQG